MTPARSPTRFCRVSSTERDLGEVRASSDLVYDVRVESSLLHGLKQDAESVFQLEMMRRTCVVEQRFPDLLGSG